MNTEAEVYELARQNRDARFDGRFFVGVLSTGIYCRPVCPVRIPKRENVRLYCSAAAAAEAGFRPCLRCRPEASPGTPAWVGSSYTVTRALQLIAQGGAGRESTETLAGELGISSRQLSRLFRKHLGASPRAVMQTRRLHFAKQLLDDTALPVSQVCFAAGFGSIRRFNDVIRDTYGLTPTQLRSKRKGLSAEQQGVQVRLGYRPPFDWRAMLDFFAQRAIPGVESVASDRYLRTISIGGLNGYLSVVFTATENSVLLQVNFPDSSRLLEIVERVRQLLDLQADSAWIESELMADPQMVPLVRGNPGLRVPGCWDGLEIAVRAIVGQQVSIKAAATLMQRLVDRTGSVLQTADAETGDLLHRVFPTADRLAGADLTGLGITGQRIAAIRSIAQAVADGELRFDGSQASEEFLQRIRTVKGIGDWTASYVALRALRDPDAFPHGDLILRRAVDSSREPLSAGQLLRRAEAWRPWRAYAVMLLWRHYQGTLQSTTTG